MDFTPETKENAVRKRKLGGINCPRRVKRRMAAEGAAAKGCIAIRLQCSVAPNGAWAVQNLLSLFDFSRIRRRK